MVRKLGWSLELATSLCSGSMGETLSPATTARIFAWRQSIIVVVYLLFGKDHVQNWRVFQNGAGSCPDAALLRSDGPAEAGQSRPIHRLPLLLGQPASTVAPHPGAQ